MPYRVDIACAPVGAFDVLTELGALDVEPLSEGLAAILPDAVNIDALKAALRVSCIAVSEATGRDDGSVWLLSPSPIRIVGKSLKLIDSSAFGTGHHPTTALCLEALREIISERPVKSLLDVGTGSGILAIAALMMGVPQAVGVDTDGDALEAAAENARLNNVADRLQLIQGGPDAVEGTSPLVVANVLAAPLMDMAPVLVRRVASGGHLILSGIHASLEPDVWRVYQRLGIRHTDSRTRAGWTAIIAQASW
jgi:ribosomal protein L11 methyltransferase